MIQVDLQNIRSFIPLPYEAALSPRLRIAHDHLQNGDGAGGEFTGWVRLPEDYDKAEFARIKAAAKKIQSDSQALVVIGIGGSYLGARGVIECLRSPNYNLKKKNTPNIYFIGNGLSSDALTEVMELVDGVDFSVNVISKSGTTTEPAVAFRFFRELLEKKYGTEEPARRLFSACRRALDGLERETFAHAWRRLTDQLPVSPEAKRALYPLGEVLGRYDGRGQQAAIAGARRELEGLRARAGEERLRLGKVYGALGVTAGAFLVILLL